MKHYILKGICGLALCLGGCAGSLPPHELLNQAVGRSFDATGFNYSTRTRVTDLVVPPQAPPTEDAQKQKLNFTAGLEILRSLSIRTDGAIDMKAKKSEVLYDFRYDRDNVEVSIRLPLMMDYATQTAYVGTSLLSTILEALYPQAPATRGKLIRINIPELLKEGAAENQELAKLLDANRFNQQSFDQLNGAVKAAVQLAVSRLGDGRFSEQPLSVDDRKAGVERRIRMQLGHDDSVSFLLDFVAEAARGLLQSGVITREMYDVVKVLTDRQQLAGTVDKYSLAVSVDAGVGASGYVNYLESRLNVADKAGAYRLGLDNVSSFSNYGAPHFTMTPEAGGTVDFSEIMKVIAADAAEQEACEDESDDAAGPPPGKF